MPAAGIKDLSRESTTHTDDVTVSDEIRPVQRIVNIDERVATLEIADKVKIKVLRERIAGRWATKTDESKTSS